ncbi:MAG: PHP domain-containing protein [Clostridia bacterium]|nr:PHP domain-containing protein [Clostridia bacterium]
MKKYLIETHCHTDESSNCGKMPAAEAVRLYRSLGYSGMLISDHLHNYTFRTLKKSNPNPTWEEKVEYFLKGYKSALNEAKKYDDFKVYLGAELRFDKNDNDYLIFGLSEEKLLKLNGIIEMRPEKGLELVKSLDCAVIQAHPFRDDCVVMKPGICHGVEVYNGHSTESRNDIALEWAQKFDFIMTSGSDFHGGTEPNGGIYVDVMPKNEDELRDIILSKNFELKTNEEF